jgi:hypothetical protein
MSEMSDADVFGSTAPGPSPVAVRVLPQVPGYVSDPSYVATPGAAPTDPFGQAPGIQLGGQQEMSDKDVFAASPGAANLKPDNALGVYAGFMKPFDRAAGALEGGARKIGLPVDTINALGAKIGLEPSASAAGQDHLAYIQQQADRGYRPGKLGQFGGNVLFGAMLPGGPVTNGALTGAALSDSNSLGGTAIDAALGGVGGKIGSSVINGAAKLISPIVRPGIQTLIDAGVPLTAGQITGGALRRVEDGSKSIPIFGDVVGAAQARSLGGLNLAVANRALAPIGESVPAGVAPGREAIAHAGDVLSDRYNSLLPTLTITPDQQFGQDLQSLGAQAAANLSGDHATQLGRLIKSSIIDKIDPATGQIAPHAMQDAETTLGLKLSRNSRSPYPADQDFSDALTTTREMLRDLVERNNPQAAPQLSALREGWRNLVIGENATAALGAHEGVFTPGQLAGAVKRSDDTVRNRGYARGTAMMQDLSDAALAHLPSKVPDSGSPFRHALEAGVAGLVGKEAGMGPAMGRAGLIGSLLSIPYTQGGQPVFQGLLAGARPSVAPAIADLVRRLQPLTASGAAAGLPQLASPSATSYPQ